MEQIINWHYISEEGLPKLKNKTPAIHCKTICNRQDMEATKMSINRGMYKEDMVHI